jgi:hypothetical protein
MSTTNLKSKNKIRGLRRLEEVGGMVRFETLCCRISVMRLSENSLNLWNLRNLRIVPSSGSALNHESPLSRI